MSSLRGVPTVGRRALAVVIGLAVVVGLVGLFSAPLSRSTDTASRAEVARADVLARELELAETQAEQEHTRTRAFILWQARVNGWGEPGEIRFGLPDDAPEPPPITPIGPPDAAEPQAPFDAWMELLFGS